MTLFLLYVAAFIALAFFDARRAKSTEGFFLNHRQSGTTEVSFSILASCVGGSATVGLCGLAFTAGFPAIWWLLSGAIGLLILTVFLSQKIRHSGALTMPELLREKFGLTAYRAITFVILIAWTAILAAQLLAMGKIIAALTDMPDTVALVIGMVFITVYTAIGGQASVMKSDVIQCLLMLGGLVLVAGLTVTANPTPLATLSFELVNDAFPLSQWAYFMCFIGGSYVVCPMLFSRMMSAKSATVARRAGFLGALGIFLTALLIVMIGVEARAFLPADTTPDNVLTALVQTFSPTTQVVFLLAMLSTILSSADSCLVTAATVASRDFLGAKSLIVTRTAVFFFGFAALILGTTGHSILGLLLMANAVYVCAVVPPAFVALTTTRPLHHSRLLATIIGAACLAILGEMTENTTWSYLALVCSMIGSLMSIQRPKTHFETA